MGSTGSKNLDDLPSNHFLQLFIGKEPIREDSVFWNDFLSFPHKQIQQGTKVIFERCRPLLNQLAANNLKTGNFGSLVRVFLNKISTIFQDNNSVIRANASEALNALLLIRFFLQYLIPKYPESELIKQIELQPATHSSQNGNSQEPLLNKFINTVILVLIGFPVLETTFLLHLECVNVLLVFLSVELFTTESVNELEIYRCIFETKHSSNLCNSLLTKFVDNGKIESSTSSSFFGLADFVNSFISGSDFDGSVLSRSAALLLIVLVNQYTGNPNPYRDRLSNVSDNFLKLYKRISSALEKEETTLLLYHLLHRNELFKNFVLEQPDIEILVVPMLQAIYKADDSSCHHMYMSLIILLILTEDVEFNRIVHKIVLKHVPWYTDRNITDMTLGGLIILVTTRTVQHNLLKMRDEYLHTNCLAALANMSSQFYQLPTYVCQRLVGLFEILSKTYNRAKQELVAIEKALRIILEVLNSCLTHQLPHNTNLIYTLLYNKHVFETFQDNPAFQDIILNINQVLEYFISKLDSLEQPCTDVESVINVIIEYSPKWASQKLQKFPELKFKYVEEEKPEEFFIPYVWSLVSESSCVHLQSSLFNKN